MLRNSLLIVFLTLIQAFAVGAMAGDYYIDVKNNSGYTIEYLYVSPGKAKNWQEDVLGNKVMPNGTSARISLTGYSSPIFDIRFEDEDGDTYTFWDVNVEKHDIDLRPGHVD